MGLLSRGFILLAIVALANCNDKPAKLMDARSREELSEQDDMVNMQPKSNLRIVQTGQRMYDYSNYDSLTARYAPQDPPSHSVYNKYIITESRLKELRSQFMYWYFDQGGPSDLGDLQKDIHHSNPQIHKNFNFQLPFYGSRFNYTRISLNGYLEFSDPPDHYTYPLSFPVKEWPKAKDPAFIGPFFSKCRIGHLRPDDIDQRGAGVYFRLERDLMTRTDMFGVEMRERLMWDIREGVVGSETFIPKHAAVITWKNVSFAGGIDNSLYTTNTFQVVLATDEVYTYAIFNYLDLQWTTHTEAGGDTTRGEGGVPAFVGFNAGNGTGSVEYKPYSQASVLRDLSGRGWANGFPGRHIFRLDEKIMLGTCNKDVAGTGLPLVFAPESGNMLGGTVVNITGPCFEEGMRVRCRFDTEEVIGTVVNKNRALCVQPYLMAEGYVRFEVSVGDNAFLWKGKYFVETPATAIERIHFQTNDVHLRNPDQIQITWEKANLTTNYGAPLSISIWGYKESTIRPQLMFIDVLEMDVSNTGAFTILPESYSNRQNSPELLDLQYGFIQINLTNPDSYSGLTVTPVLWSRPIPLGWYFNKQWERKYSAKWPEALCDRWLMYDRYLKDFAQELPVCPCTLQHAKADLGRFLPDPTCDQDINPECLYHKGAIHCVRSGAPRLEGSEQQCCYDRDGFLMLSYDQQWGSRPRRSHNLGFLPWNEANKVPTLSQWYHDVIPYYTCCLWQNEQAVGCETLRFERRPSQDCVAYQSPSVATVFGDPHFITFDNVEYTFNGKGEFVLVQANRQNELLNIQARFEQVPDNIYGEVRATQLTSIAAQDNSSAIIEVKIRPPHAQWRYRLDVLADGRRVYFDRPALKMQHFSGVTVFTPSRIIDQSQVVIMFPSGAGVEVVEDKGFMSARVYLPWTFVNKTRGLFGNWSFDVTDEFVLPDGNFAGVSADINNFEALHRGFAINWMLEEGDESLKGQSLFTREFNRLGSYYTNKTFVPEYQKNPVDFIPVNRSQDIMKANDLCGQSYQCKYDYGMTLNHDLAKATLKFRDNYISIRSTNEKIVKSCGVLETPRFGRKSTFRFVPGTKVQFECNQDFTPVGDKRRTCLPDGRWDVPEYGYTECLRKTEYELQKGWFATGIIAAIMLPLIIAMLCIYLCYKKNKNKTDRTDDNVIAMDEKLKDYLIDLDNKNRFDADKKRDLDIVFSTKVPQNEKPLNDKPLVNVATTDPVGKRVYDAVYRTKEPMKDRPLVDFSDRDPDLSLVEDDSSLWVRPKSFTGSKSSDDSDLSFKRNSRIETNVPSSGESDGETVTLSNTPNTPAESELNRPRTSDGSDYRTADSSIATPPPSKAVKGLSRDSSSDRSRSTSRTETPDFMKPSRFLPSSDGSDVPPLPRASSINTSGRSASSSDGPSSSDGSKSKSDHSKKSSASKGSAIQTSI